MGWTLPRVLGQGHLQEPSSPPGPRHNPRVPSEKVVSAEVCPPEGIFCEPLKPHSLAPLSQCLKEVTGVKRTSFQ